MQPVKPSEYTWTIYNLTPPQEADYLINPWVADYLIN